MRIDFLDQTETFEWIQDLDLDDYAGPVRSLLAELKRWQARDFEQLIRQGLQTYPPSDPHATLEVTLTEEDLMEDGDDPCAIIKVWFDVVEGKRKLAGDVEMWLILRPGDHASVYWPKTEATAPLR